MSRAAERAERIALAILAGDVGTQDVADAFAALKLANAEKAAERQAAALRAYRAGEPVWSWPATAPWAGFGNPA